MERFTSNDDEILIGEIQKYPPLFNYENENYKNFNIKEAAWKEVALIVGKSTDDCKKRWRSVKDTYFRNKKKQKLGTGSSASEKSIKWNLYKHLSFLDLIKHERNSKNTLELTDSQYETDIENVTNDSSLDYADEEDANSSQLHTPSLQSTKKYITVQDDNSLTSDSPCSTPTSAPKTKRLRLKESSNTFFTGFEERAQKRMEILEALHNKKKSSESEDEVDVFMKSISITVKKLPPFLINEAKIGILTLVNNLQFKATSMPSFTPQTTFQTASSRVDPFYSSNYNGLIPHHGHTLNNHPINDNSPTFTSQYVASTIQSNPYRPSNSSEYIPYSFAQSNNHSFPSSYFQSYCPQQPNTCIGPEAITTSTVELSTTTLSNSEQSHSTT